MKNIYIVLIKAHTGLGSAARKITRYEYTHTAVSLNGSLTDFLSFSRRRHYMPFDAGFMHEKRDFYAFGKHTFFKAKVFRLNITDENFSRVMKFIRKCESDTELIFNLISMATMPVFHGINIPKAYNCMSFTAGILQLSGVKLGKPFYKYSVKDIDELLSDKCIFEGNLQRIPSSEYEEYMKKCPPLEYFILLSNLTVIKSRRIKNLKIRS
ncbi:MAG: hypothetical protein J6B75_00810 [Ruminococcus sp.]|nr:hypothetical protein [Ruminococcus sp.]